MTHALLYRPGRKGRVAIAFGAAVLIHVAAVGFAGVQQQRPIDEAPIGNPWVIAITVDPPEPEDPISPPDAPSPPPISNPTENSFPDQQSTPPPIQKQLVKSVAPIHRDSSRNPGVVSNSSTAKAFALNAPRPEYPYEARRSKITGEGIVVMTIDPITGNVTDASMWKSTGSPYLDNAATSTFRRWRFKTGSVSKVMVPITFTLTGASY